MHIIECVVLPVRSTSASAARASATNAVRFSASVACVSMASTIHAWAVLPADSARGAMRFFRLSGSFNVVVVAGMAILLEVPPR